MSEVPTTVESEGNRQVRARRQRTWSRFLGVALALHIPLFFYPILRLCGWLGLPWWATAIVFFPLAGKLRYRSWRETMLREMTLEGVLSVSEGDHPSVLEQKLLAFVHPQDEPGARPATPRKARRRGRQPGAKAG